MLNKLFVFPVLFFTTGCKSSSPRLDGEVYQRAAECLSETDEESVVCFVGLLGEYSQEYIEETVFGRPRNIEEKNIEVCESHGCMTLKAWSYLPRHPEPVVSIILLPGMRSSHLEAACWCCIGVVVVWVSDQCLHYGYDWVWRLDRHLADRHDGRSHQVG
jgi:hypothetical protein